MSSRSDRRPEQAKRRRAVAAGVVIAAVGLGGGTALVHSQGSGPGIVALPAGTPAAPTPSAPPSASTTPSRAASPSATPSSSTSAAPSPSANLDQKSAEAVVGKYLVAVQREASVKANKDAKRKLAAVAAGADLAELDAQQAELDSNGWTQKGQVKVDQVKVLQTRLKAKPPTVVVQACFDSSGVTTYDSAGVALPRGSKDTQRSLNTVTFQHVKGQWLVVDRSFPKDPAC